jgi:hypothetical protein
VKNMRLKFEVIRNSIPFLNYFKEMLLNFAYRTRTENNYLSFSVGCFVTNILF